MPGVLVVGIPPGYVFRIKGPVNIGRLQIKPNSKTPARLVFDTDIIYIGETERTLPIRIKELILRGLGKGTQFRGGQEIWLLEGNDSFQVYWKASDNPLEIKKKLLQKFKEQHHGKRPFGNKTG